MAALLAALIMVKRVPVRSTVRGESWFHAGTVPARADAETHRLYAQLQRRRFLSPYGGRPSNDRLASQLLAAALRSRTIPDTLRDAFATCARELVACEAELFELPELPPEHSITDGVATRAMIRNRLAFFENDKRLVADWINTLARCLGTIIDAVPSIDQQPAALIVPVPILNFVDNPTEIVRQVVTDLMRFAPDPRALCTPPGANLAARITSNLLAISRTTFDAAQKHPERLKWPGSDRATPQELVSRYLGDTPMASLFDASIPLAVGHKPRFEGTHVLARPGHGKTQLLQSLFMADVDDPARPSLVFIDSQADAINVLSRLERFNPAHDDRLLILDPSDTEWPLKLNIFDIDRARIDKLDLGAREEIYEGVIEIWTYIFGGLLGSELTSRQALVFRFLAQLILAIPDATIHTLVALLKDPTPYLGHVDKLPPSARAFLTDHLFNDRDREYNQARSQLLRRLWHVLSNPVFERMMGHPRNAVDFKYVLDSGKILLINTAKGRLKQEWSQIFGRVCIARILQATLERAADPVARRRPAFIFIDECHEYLDQTTELFLLQARKYKCGLVLAHQNIEGQLKNPGLKAALTTTAIRFVGEVSAADAMKLAPDMRTNPEFLLGLRKRERASEFAVHVRGVTPTAVKITLPFLAAESAPKMSAAAYAKLLARIRSQVATPLADVINKPRSKTTDIISTDPDEFGDRY